jgi:SAM-dependent methyltransferase
MPDPGQLTVGNSPLSHMLLLAGAPERILALRLALSSVIEPSSVVLDAGCGSLGVLAIMAAQLGARRVVAVDTGRLDLAQALAEENGVADRIEFRQRNLADLPDDAGRFDVILGMIYFNDPRRDLAQQQLMAGIATRFARPGTVFIPGTVRYTVAGYAAGADSTDRTAADRWTSAVGRAEALTGIAMAAISHFPAPDYAAFRRQPGLPGSSAGRAGLAELTLLSSRELFAEISYADPATAAAYPPAVELAVTAPGRLDTTIWRQDLLFGNLLIRRTEATQRVTRSHKVQPGDIAVLATDESWGDTVPLTVRRNGGAAG